MRFTAPGYLALLLLLVWFGVQGGRQLARRRDGLRRLVVRCAVAGLLILALAGLQIAAGRLPLAVIFLVDASHSMSASQAEVQSRLSSLASRLGRDDQAGVILFGARPVMERGLGQPGNAAGQMAATVAGGATDIEAALRLGRNTLSFQAPPEGSRRIVLLSDGNETRGSAMREAARAAADGIAIDASVPSPHASSPPLRVSRLSAPVHAAIGEPFAITALIEGPPEQRAELVIEGDDGTSIRREVRFGANGSATETLTAREREPGLRVYRASIQTLEGDFAAGPSEPTAGALVNISGTPRVLVVGASAGRLDGILASSYDVRHLAPADLPGTNAGFSTYDAVVLDDVGEDTLDARQMAALSSYVETRGAGLLVLGSPRTLDAAVVPDSGLGKLLPVDVRPRAGVRAPELALVVVFDKSGSMDERVGGVAKIELARQSITRVLEAVPATDSVGVIAFDSRPTTVATLRAGHDPRAIAEQLRTLSPAGATAIAPAVELASQWLSAFPTTVRRHILLVSDGRSSTADSERLRSLAREGRFTLSVVSLGADRDQQFLSALAAAAGGRAYFPEDQRQLPTIAAREAARVAGGRVVEEAFVPRTSSHPILGGIDPRAMPALGGYVVTAAKRSAEVALASHRDDPIIATWQYGVGRVAVYTADLSSTWSAGLRRSPILSPLMNQAVRWLARRQPDDSLYARLQADGDVVRVLLDAQATDDGYTTGLSSHAIIQPPTGQPLTIDLAEKAPGRYEGTFPASDVGEYVISLTARSGDGRVDARMIRGFFWSGDKEYRAVGVNRDLLSQLARTTGGTLLEGDSDAFSSRPRAYRSANVWLLTVAFLLFLGDLIAPGIAVILRRVFRRQTVPSERAAA
jgi:Mg-chelatase subunit ChlD